MLKNTECASIIQVVRAGSGRTFDIDAARYGRIIFMADADSDGAHIRCLLATLFFKYMPELISEGRVYSAVPPLHRIEISQPKKGMGKYVYTYSDDELQRKLAELKKKGVKWKDRCSATRVWARWTPTSWPRRRWTRGTARCAGSPWTTPTPRPGSSSC